MKYFKFDERKKLDFMEAVQVLDFNMQKLSDNATSAFPNAEYIQVGGETMTCDEAKAIFFLLQSSLDLSDSVLDHVNERMSDCDSAHFQSLLPFLELLMSALWKLHHTLSKKLCCVAHGDMKEIFPFMEGQTVELANIMSAVESQHVDLKSISRPHTIFFIEAASASCVSDFSGSFPLGSHDEMLLLPGTRFEVVELVRGEMSTSVTLKQLPPSPIPMKLRKGPTSVSDSPSSESLSCAADLHSEGVLREEGDGRPQDDAAEIGRAHV